MQEIGGQITYLKRYSLSSICSLFADSDNDAKEVEGQKILETISKDEVELIMELLTQLPQIETERLLKWCQISKVSNMPKEKFNSSKRALESKIAKEANND